MHTVEYVLLVYAIVVTVASFLNFIRLDYWWIRIWDFPHLQLTLLAAIGLVCWLVFDHTLTGWYSFVPIGLLATLCYQGWLIYPFTPLHKKQVVRVASRTGNDESDANTIRLLVANVLMDNSQTDHVVNLVNKHKPDVLLLLEANQKWQDALAPVAPDYPHQVLHPLENTYGMLLYSRLPIRYHELRFLIQDDIPSVYAQLELPSTQIINFYGVHPMPPSPTEHYRSTERDAELLLVGKEARKRGGATIIAGDLNDVAWSHTTRLFQRVSGLLDPRIGRGLYNTFHAWYFFLRWPLDHVFVSTHFQLQKILRLPNGGSDHFPMFISLTYVSEPERANEEVPEPEKDDLEEAHEKISEAKES